MTRLPSRTTGYNFRNVNTYLPATFYLSSRTTLSAPSLFHRQIPSFMRLSQTRDTAQRCNKISVKDRHFSTALKLAACRKFRPNCRRNNQICARNSHGFDSRFQWATIVLLYRSFASFFSSYQIANRKVSLAPPLLSPSPKIRVNRVQPSFRWRTLPCSPYTHARARCLRLPGKGKGRRGKEKKNRVTRAHVHATRRKKNK